MTRQFRVTFSGNGDSPVVRAPRGTRYMSVQFVDTTGYTAGTISFRAADPANQQQHAPQTANPAVVKALDIAAGTTFGYWLMSPTHLVLTAAAMNPNIGPLEVLVNFHTHLLGD